MTKSNAQLSPNPKPGPSGDETRARLLAATAALIAERGWGSVTTRAVAERAGVNQGLVHYHFGNMDALRRESVVAVLMPEIHGLVDEMLDDRPITESIRRVMGRLDQFGLDTEIGALLLEALLQATRNEAVVEVMSGAMRSWVEMLEPRLRVAQERGVIRDDVEPAALGQVLGAVLDGFIFQRMADPGADPDLVADTLIQLVSPIQEHHT